MTSLKTSQADDPTLATDLQRARNSLSDPLREGSQSRQSSVRICLIENHPDNQKLMSYLLQSCGYQVSLADSGEAGLELIRGQDFDLILCDIRMPGVDGYEVARRLKADPHRCRIRLIACSALTSPADVDEILAAGFDGCISKAIAPRLFLQQVQSFLSSVSA